MNKKPIFRAIKFGFYQVILLFIGIFVLSLVFGTDDAPPPALGFVILAVAMTFVSSLFGRLMKPASRNRALAYGLLWSFMTILILLVITIGNGTQAVIFGSWGAYLVFIGQAIGPMLMRRNTN